jgi:hypothetical protein
VLLIFYFYIINDVQNPHVSVLKLIFYQVLFVDIKLGLDIKHWLKKSARLKLGWGLKNLHGIRAELKGSRDFSSQKVGTAVTSQGRFLNLLFSAEKGQWLQV